MTLRSWLFVPGDSAKKLGKALATGADAIIVDLEDSVAAENKMAARDLARDWLVATRRQLTEQRRIARWVRINDLDSRLWRDDLVAVMPGAPDGIMLPKAAGPEAVTQLAAELYELEGRAQVTAGATKILPLVSETPASAMTIARYIDASLPRLAGLTWGAEDLSAAIGASRKRDERGWTDAFRMVRAQTLLTAHARGAMAIDTLHADFNDNEGLKAIAEASRADGFTGMLAIHPVQVPIINAAFTASEAELAEARAIVERFAANPGAGALQIDRRMIDQPHLKLAKRLLGIDD
ncbi:MAG: HpcH/HpaI aldolase/citrate lyase family protein [Novosphingobium sp.]